MTTHCVLDHRQDTHYIETSMTESPRHKPELNVPKDTGKKPHPIVTIHPHHYHTITWTASVYHTVVSDRQELKIPKKSHI